MSRWGLIVASLFVFVLVATQIALPSLAERKVEDRLTSNGGSADVTMGALPALRLLFSDGERFEVDAHDLDLDIDQQQEIFTRLDGFSLVDVSIANSMAGPIELTEFELHRDGLGPYRLTANGETTPGDLAAFGLDQLEVPAPATGLLDMLLDPFVESVDGPVPIALDMELESTDGQIEVVSGDSEIAGIPAGPLAELITSAFVVRL